ncbi:MAG: leucine-rich repeat protein, partial [Oscillospiraceae bacterium]|nr:leucine-rich repeat protein [Oscillospiraceae bacterium]
MKRLLSLLLALILMVGMIPFSARAATLDNGLEYEVFDTYVAITDYNGYAEKLTIPARIEGFPVTVIGENAFSFCDTLREVILPEGIVRIEDDAFFWCENLTTISLPETLSVIDPYAFYHCINLTNIDLPGNLTVIDDWAFAECSSLLQIEIPDSVTYIGAYAFTSCTELLRVRLSNRAASIGEHAFADCDSLTNIAIPASVREIGPNAFAHCNSLLEILVDENNPVYSSWDGALFNKDRSTIFRCPGGRLGSFTLPATVKDLNTDPYIFYSVNESFYYGAFAGCYSLTDIHVETGSPFFSSQNGIIYSRDGTELVLCPVGKWGDLTIPYGVTRLRSGSFEECRYLNSITLPESLSTIASEVFTNCYALTRVQIPESVTSIESYAFTLCTSLTDITIPAGVREFGRSAFSYCDLETIRFRGSAPRFDDCAFLRCSATVYFPKDDSSWTPVIEQEYGGTITWVPYNPNNPFTDVPIGSFYEAPVLWAVENGITSGATETTFNPNGACLRAQVVTFLHRAEGSPAPISPVNPFTDVKKTDFFYTPVLWAVHKG